MSGGSLGYVGIKAENGDMTAVLDVLDMAIEHVESIRRVATGQAREEDLWLSSAHKIDENGVHALDRALATLTSLNTGMQILQGRVKAAADLLHAIEWSLSGKGADTVVEAMTESEVAP